MRINRRTTDNEPAREPEPVPHLAHCWPAPAPPVSDAQAPRQLTASIDPAVSMPLGHGCYRVRRVPSQ